MKTIQIVFLLCVSLFAEAFPTMSDPFTATSEFSEVPESNSSTTFILYDGTTNTETNLTSNPNNYSVDNFGTSSLQNDVNVSSPQNLKGFSEANKDSVVAKGAALFQSLSVQVGGVNTDDTETLKADYILQNEVNSSEAKAIQFNQDFYTRARSLVANLKTIECYVSRTLVNSYYCPLPGMENSFFKGGAVLDSKENAKKECEKLCQIPVGCVSKDMNKDLQTYNSIALALNNNEHDVDITIDSGMSVQYLELTFDSLYQYDDNISVNSQDYNASAALEALQKTEHRVRASLSYTNEIGESVILVDSMTINIDDIHKIIKLYFPTFHSSNLKLHLYTPFLLDNNTTTVYDPKLTATLTDYKIKYTDNKWWFCPETHFVSDATQCSGEIKNVVIGSQSYNVCVTESNKKREPVYGAYYSQEQCEYACKNTADCVPTYRHLTNFDAYNIPVALSNVEVGCVDSPSNTSCTRELCIKYFEEDTMPYMEKNWTNDDEVKLTVDKGIPSKTLIRPRIDLAGELSANDDEVAKKQVAIKEMSEITYQNMLRNGTYDISHQKISENIPFKYGYSLEKNTVGSKALVWKMRPNSFDINNTQSYYVYVLYDVYTTFLPVASSYLNKDGTMSQWMDRTFILKTPSSYKVVRRVENFAKYNAGVPDQNISSSWVNVDSMMKDNFEFFDGLGFTSYDKNSDADYMSYQPFDAGKSWEEFTLYNSVESLMSTQGAIFNTQDSRNNGLLMDRVFDAPNDPELSSKFYGMDIFGIYSANKLSYRELFDKIYSDPKKYIIYSTSTKTNQDIRSDGEYDLDEVKMYISGTPSNMSVKADFTPRTKEEGKRAFIFMLLFDKQQ